MKSFLRSRILRTAAILWLLSCLLFSKTFADSVNKSVTLSRSVKQVSAPIRRLGIVPVKTNVSDWRRFFDGSFDDSSGQAVANMPLSAAQMTDYLTSALERVVEANGRFTAATLTTESQEKGSVLEKEMDLDGVLLSELRWEGDRAELKLWIKPRKDLYGSWLTKSVTLVRENVSLELRFTEKDLLNSMSQLLARMVSSLGYLGQVTNLKDQLALLDFGKETGLDKGDRIDIGVIFSEELHPVSGEVLRSKRVSFYEAQVVEARLGSSLVELISEDRQKLLEHRLNKGPQQSLRYFAWKSQPKNGKLTPGQESLQGVVGMGFKEQNTERAATHSNHQGQDSSKDVSIRKGNTDSVDVIDTENSEEERTKEEDFDLSKVPVQMSKTWFGLGMNFGTLGTDLGNRFTSFPSSVLNHVSLALELKGPEKMTIEPIGQLSFFSGGDVKGFGASLGLAVFVPVSDIGSGFAAGAALQGDFGEVKTIRVKHNLGDFSLLGLAKWTSGRTSIGIVEPRLGISVFGIFGGTFAFQTKLTLLEIPGLPKNLGGLVGYERSSEKWTQIKLGGLWNFGDHRS